MAKTRLEKDSMGELAVPAEALYGASTERAVINFPISDLRFQSSFIRALAILKLAVLKSISHLATLMVCLPMPLRQPL